MKYKHIQAAHELRMWIVTLAAGAAAANALLEKHPKVKESIEKKVNAVKGKFKKKEEPTIVQYVVIREEKES